MSGKRRFGKRLMSIALAFALTLSCVPVDVYATEAEVQDEAALDEVVEEPEEEILEETETQTYIPDVELPSNEELFAGYVEQKMYGYEFSFWGVAARERLTESGKQFYDKLKAEIKKIASGEKNSTIMSIDAVTLNSWNVNTTIVAADNSQALEILKERLDLDHVFSALLCDCPYDLYWFDKTVGFLYGASTSETSITESTDKNYAVGSFTCGLSVAAAYQPSDYEANSPTVDITKTSAASAAVANAQAVVAEHAGKTDYEKLIAYRDYICEETQYNHSAAALEYKGGYGDPWQLIYVFDNNDNTAVVCEGYSKAFQYLCDLSTFDNSAIACYIATGYMSGGTGAGPHMWNIVTMEDNKNYLVDITNSDQDTVGQNGDLFLAGGTAVSSNSTVPLSGYRFMVGNSPIDYYYDNDLIWDNSVLNIASADYVPKMHYSVSATVENLTFEGNATVVEGENYTAALTAAQGYVLPTEIEITVGENKLQAEQDYTYENGTITIPAEKITGAIVITATGNPCPHSNYTYIGSDAVITVICAGCGKEVGTVTISAQNNLVYNGSAKEAAVAQSVAGLFAGTPVYEQKNGDTWISLDHAPTKVGTYKASITLGNATASVEFTIAAKAFEGINVTPGKGTWTNVVGMETPLFSISADDYSKIAADMELYVSTDDGTNWQKDELKQSGSTYQSTKTLQDVLGNSVGNVNFKVKLIADNFADWVSENYAATLSPLVLSENNASLTLEGLQNGGVYYTGNEQTPKASLNITKDGDSVYSISSDTANQMVTFTYADNVKIGTATVSVTGNGTQITGNVSVSFEIKYYDTEAGATVSSETWAKSVSVNAPGNFTISQDIDGSYTESFTVSQQSDTPAGTEVTYYLKENGTGYITDAKKLTVYIDISAPQFEGEGFGIKITDRDAWWQKLLTKVSFNLYKSQKVIINANDNLSGVDSYYYYFDNSGSEKTKTENELKALSFEKVTGSEFGMNSDGRYVIYAYAVDKAGNQSDYISSDGIIIDATEPEISLIEDNHTVVDETCEKAVLFGASEAVTYFYAVEKNYPSAPVYRTLGDLAYMNGERWSAKEGITEGELTEAGTKGIVLKELTPNTNYRVSLGAVDSAGNRFRDVASIVFTTSKVTPVFDNLTASLSGTYGDGISNLIAQLPIKSTNGVEGVWSTSYTSVLNVGTHNVPLTFTPYDTDKYNVFSTQIIVNITAKDISAVADITVAGSFVYNGSAHTPETVVKLGDVLLTKDKDYTVSYENNTNAGTATVKVRGTGNYKGTATTTFTIDKMIFNNPYQVQFSDGTTAPTKEYDGTVAIEKEAVKVKFVLPDHEISDWFAVEGNMAVVTQYTDVNAGNAKTYRISVIFDEDFAKNYEIQSDSIQAADGIITKAPLTLKAEDKVIFVNDSAPTYTYVVEGLKDDDKVEDVFGTVEFSTNEIVDTSKEGTYTISITKAELTGTLGENYQLNAPYETGTLTITTHQHEWSYTANDTNNTITATCSGDIGTCPNAGEVIISLEEPDDCIYSGTVKEVKVSMSKETEAFGVIAPSYTGANLTDGNAINAGNYSASITVGDKSVSVEFEIAPKSLANANVQVNGTYTYDGKVIVPDVTVVLDDTTLTKDTDYTVAGNDINAGNALVTVTGKGNYKGSVSQVFTIERKAVIVNADTATKVYGSEDPVLTYTVDGSTPLVSGDILEGKLQRAAGEDSADYDITQGTLTNANNKNYDITFVGSIFTITPKEIQKPVITLSQNGFEYSGSAHTPSVTVKDGADVLAEGIDYTVNYEDNTAVGTAKAVVKLKDDGNYIVNRTLSAEFAITKKKLTVVSAVAQDKEYDGTTAVNITSVVLSGIIGSELVETDASNVTAELEKANVGTYTSVVLSDLTLTGINSGNYELEAGKHTVSTVVKITAKPLAGAVVTIEEGTYTYKASEIKPQVTVVLNGKTLIHNTDYTVAYADNVNAGTATVTVTGCGNYKDTATGTFTIGKAKVVLTAEDKTAFQGDDKPTPTYKVNGLLGNDKLITEPLLKYEETLDMDKVGTYAINVSDADAGQNYEIQYADGVLYVKKTGVEQILIKSEQNIISKVKGELLSIEGLDTPEEIKEELTRVTMIENPGYNKKDIEHYEVTLKYSLDGGESWIEATESNFPQGGICIKLKYPNGTGKHTHDFVVTHMFTENSDKLGTVAGRTEQPPVTKLDDGLEVILNGLSPVSIAWKEISKTPSKDGDSSSSDQGDQSISMFGDKNGTAEHERLTQTAKTSQSTASGGLAPTGDTAQPVGVLLLAAAALAGVGGVKYYKKKKVQKRNYNF